MKKRLLASLLTLCMAFTLLSAAALAVENDADSTESVICAELEGCAGGSHAEDCPAYAAPASDAAEEPAAPAPAGSEEPLEEHTPANPAAGEDDCQDAPELDDAANAQPAAEESALSGIASYEELVAAINAASAGDTLTLASNITGSILLNKSITLDLNQYSITGQVRIENEQAVVTVKNGTLNHNGTSTNTATLCIASGKVIAEYLTVGAAGNTTGTMAIAAQGDLEATGLTVTSTGYGIGMLGETQTVLNNCNVIVYGNPISTNVAGQTGMSVTINGGSYESTNAGGNWSYVAVYWASHGSLTINENASFTSASGEAAGLYVKNGTIKINGGRFFGTKDGVKVTSEESNSTGIGVTILNGSFSGSRSGLYIKTKTGGAEHDYKVTVEGGSFSGAVSVCVNASGFDPDLRINNGVFNADIKSQMSGFIYGGTYRIDPRRFLAPGYAAIPAGIMYYVYKMSGN